MTHGKMDQARQRASQLRQKARYDLDRAEQARSDALAALREADRIERLIHDPIGIASMNGSGQKADQVV